jgi:hypothetical protein
MNNFFNNMPEMITSPCLDIPNDGQPRFSMNSQNEIVSESIQTAVVYFCTHRWCERMSKSFSFPSSKTSFEKLAHTIMCHM